MKKTIIILLFLAAYTSVAAQKAKVGIGTASPQTVLDVASTKNGILIPRQTASQIQNMLNPHESELIYSLTDDGTTINMKGFWYFRGAWYSLLETNVNANNIYTVNGTVTSDRQVAQDGKFLSLGPGLLYIDGAASTIGLLTNSPTQTLDVNGEVRIQTLNKVGNIVSDAQGVLMHDADFFDVGDVKPSYSTTDHDGWYLLDGRNISSLPQTAQDNASNILGITTSLPNASGRYSMGTSSTPGSISGSNTITLTRANLPAFNFNYSTNSVGAHSHTITYERIRANTVNGGGNNIHSYWLSGSIVGGANYANQTSSFTGHNHTYSASSGGNSDPVDIQPSALNVSYFIYLGQ